MHLVVTGLAFGDEGKGSIVDFAARKGYRLGVRFNGGHQAGHNVVTSGGIHHTFSQFSACLLAENTRSVLSRFVFVDPFALDVEGRILAEKTPNLRERSFISLSCPVVTPFHRTLNRLRETARGGARHGSCGAGIFEAFKEPQERRIVMRQLFAADLAERLEQVRLRALEEAERIAAEASPSMREAVGEYLLDLKNPRAAEWIAAEYSRTLARPYAQLVEDEQITAWLRSESAVFEGAQGFLLDMEHGFFPHVTPSKTDATNALSLVEEAGASARVVGVVRTYYTRHGQGPFPSESKLDFAEPHNSPDSFQGAFRRGHFDRGLFRRAVLQSVRVDEIAVTHCDAFKDAWPVFADGRTHYEDTAKMSGLIAEWSSRAAGILSSGPLAGQKEAASSGILWPRP